MSMIDETETPADVAPPASDAPAIIVTPKAALKAVALAQRDGLPKMLRIGVKGGGCSGFSYFYAFETVTKDNDHVWEVQGLTVVCDAKSMKLLSGTVLDYDSNLLKGGFKFGNPKAKRVCGCGESFTM